MNTITLNLLTGGTIDVDAEAVSHVQVEDKGCTVVVQRDGEPPQSYHVYESISRLRSLMK